MEGGQTHCVTCGAHLTGDARFCGTCGAAVEVAAGSSSPRRVGRFALGPIIGHGGMGVVHRAHDGDLGRDVALKLIAPSLADDPGFRTRFKGEARAAAAVDHPNVLPVFEAGEDGGELYLAMRMVDGTDLKAILVRESRLSPARAAGLVAQIAAALDAAHVRGLIHRDVKPANALIAGAGDDEHVYLTDFGLTQIADRNVRVTNPGQVVGTADYIAPEQIAGQQFDGRVDVYALACVAFECLAGKPPFARDTVPATLSAHLSDEIPVVTDRNPVLRDEVNDVLEGGLMKNPEQRFASCGAFARALGAALGTDTGAVPADPRVATHARPRPAPAPAPSAAARVPTLVMAADRPRRTGAGGRALTVALSLLAAGALIAAGIVFVPLLLDSGHDGTNSARTLSALSAASAVNGSLSALISRLARDPASETEREGQQRRLSALRTEVRRLRAATGEGVDAAVRPVLSRALRGQEQLLDQYGRVLNASPAEAQPSIDAMLATLGEAESDLASALDASGG